MINENITKLNEYQNDEFTSILSIKNHLLNFETIISYFDIQIGPAILFNSNMNENSNNDSKFLEEIVKLMDVHEAGDFFVHYYKGKITANYVFKLRDDFVRGGEHLIMVSLIFSKIDSSKSILIFEKINEIEIKLKNYSTYLITKTQLAKILRNLNSRNEVKISQDIIKRELLNSLRRKSI